MKKILALILSATICLTAMVGCQKPETTNNSDNTDISKVNTVYSALDEIPYNTENTVSATQLEDKLYILESDGVYKLDLLNAEAKCIYKTDSVFYIASGDGVIYLADEGKTVYIIDQNGTLLDTVNIPEGVVDISALNGSLEGFRMNLLMDFIVTKDYFVFAYRAPKGYVHTYIRKDDLSVTTNSSGGFNKIANYEGNKYFTYVDADSSLDTYIFSYDIDSKEQGEKIYIGDMVVDFCYDSRSKNLKYYTSSSFGMALCEFDIEAKERTQLSIFTKESSVYNWNCEVLTCFNNLFTVVSNNLKRIEIYDTEKEYPVVNLAIVGYPQRDGFLVCQIKG